MYNKYAKARSLIAYNFLGQYVTEEIPDEIIEEQLDEIGLNDLITDLNEEANIEGLDIEERIDLIGSEFEAFCEDYYDLHRDHIRTVLSPVLEEMVLIDVKDYDLDGNLQYDVYMVNEDDMTEITKANIRFIMEELPEDVYNTNLIVVMVDILVYGKSICQIVL